MKKTLIRMTQAPGDSISLTAFVRDFTKEFPEIQLGVNCTGGDEIFKNNPHVTALDTFDESVTTIKLDYKHWVNQTILGARHHYYHASHVCYKKDTGIEVPKGEAKPELFLSPEEDVPPEDAFQYWVIAPGNKTDIPAKAYPGAEFQNVISYLPDYVWKQVGSAGEKGHRIKHINPELNGVVNLIDKTTLRQLMVLIKYSRGVLCHLSMPMLVAQAFNRPCVVVAGNREALKVFEYPNTEFLASTHLLPCATENGCYCTGVVKPHEYPLPSNWLCKEPRGSIAGCMDMIPALEVASAVAMADELTPEARHNSKSGV